MKSRNLIIGTVSIVLIFTVLCLFIPLKTKESITIPAVVICNGELQEEITDLMIDGTWTRSTIFSSYQSFSGKIQVEMLEYTHKEDGWDLNFQITDEASVNCLSGGFFYNSHSDFEGYGWLYTDKGHDYYVLVTNQFDNQNNDYIVIAPAETEDAAKHICDVMGLNYFQD